MFNCKCELSKRFKEMLQFCSVFFSSLCTIIRHLTKKKSVTCKVLRFQETDLIFLWFKKITPCVPSTTRRSLAYLYSLPTCC